MNLSSTQLGGVYLATSPGPGGAQSVLAAATGSAQFFGADVKASLAALAQIKGWAFEFYVHHIPSWLKSSPIGNYRGALDLGMKITAMQDIGSELHPSEYGNSLFV